MSEIVNKNINTHLDLITKDRAQILKKTVEFKNLILSAIKRNKKILICGNGGSAADAQHICTEMTVRMKKNRRSLPFISLTTDTSAITAIGNDYEFNKIFSRQLEGVGQSGDILIPITTSGNSKNIIEVCKIAKVKKIKVLGILGNSGGNVKKYCDKKFIVSASDPTRVQEIHILFWHSLCDLVERSF